MQYLFFALIALFFGYLLFDAFGKPVGRTKPEPRKQREDKQREERDWESKDQETLRDDDTYEPYAYTGQSQPKEKQEVPEKLIAPGANRDAIAEGLEDIGEADPDFDLQAFLPRASRALEIVLGAYQDREREDLQALLSPDLYEAFDEAITAAEESGDNSKLTLIAVGDPRVVSAEMDDTVSVIKLSIRLEQLIAQRDPEAGEVEGQGETVIETSDYTFARDVNSDRRTWQLRAIEDA